MRSGGWSQDWQAGVALTSGLEESQIGRAKSKKQFSKSLNRLS
jgi:hypothetical protein